MREERIVKSYDLERLRDHLQGYDMYTFKSAHMFVREIFMFRSKIRNYEDIMSMSITFAIAGQHNLECRFNMILLHTNFQTLEYVFIRTTSFA